jgi:hypothetical protein
MSLSVSARGMVLQLNGRCRQAVYGGKESQKADWKWHKGVLQGDLEMISNDEMIDDDFFSFQCIHIFIVFKLY